MPRNAVTAGLLAVLLAVTACSGSGTDEAEAVEGYSVLGALAEVPAAMSAETLNVLTADLGAASEVARVTRPEDTEDMEAVLDWMNPLSGFPVDGKFMRTVYVPLGPTLARPFMTLDFDQFEDQMGWSAVDVDTFVEAYAGPVRHLVVSGDIDPDAEHSGSDHLSVALTQGKAVVASESEFVSAWLEGEGPTLADDEAWVALAEALDGGGVLAAMLLPGSGRSVESGDASTLPPAWSHLGIGWGQESMVLAYRYPAAEDAEDALPAFERQFRDQDLPFGDALRQTLRLRDAEVDGSVVVLTVRPTADGSARTLHELLSRWEAPFLHR